MCRRGAPRVMVIIGIAGTEAPGVKARPVRAWVGVDVGKAHHWVCVVDGDGKTLLSVKICNDEAQIKEMISAVRALADDLIWAVDIIGAPSALVLALLAEAGVRVSYAS